MVWCFVNLAKIWGKDIILFDASLVVIFVLWKDICMWMDYKSLYIIMIQWIRHVFWFVLIWDLSENRHINDVTSNNFLLLYYVKQIDAMLLCFCSVIYLRRLLVRISAFCISSVMKCKFKLSIMMQLHRHEGYRWQAKCI